MFWAGVAVGFSACLAGLAIGTRVAGPWLQGQLDEIEGKRTAHHEAAHRERLEAIASEIAERPLSQEIKDKIRAAMDARSDTIEAKGVTRLAAACEQAARTGKPVALEIGGEAVVMAIPGPKDADAARGVLN